MINPFAEIARQNCPSPAGKGRQLSHSVYDGCEYCRYAANFALAVAQATRQHVADTEFRARNCSLDNDCLADIAKRLLNSR